MGTSQEAKLDEIQWRSAQAVHNMGGIHNNTGNQLLELPNCFWDVLIEVEMV